jgi:hypothetical protein
MQNVLRAAIRRVDFAVDCGYRDPVDQFELFQVGREEDAKGRWVIVDQDKVLTNCDGYQIPSNHNKKPSPAADCVPCGPNGKPVWNDEAAFDRMAAVILAEAKEQGVKMRWGGIFRKPKDKPHFEIV